MRTIFLKEVSSFFSSIVGYVALLVFLIAGALFVWVLPDTNALDYGYANLIASSISPHGYSFCSSRPSPCALFLTSSVPAP